MARLFKKTVTLSSMAVTRLEMSFTPPNKYTIVVGIRNPDNPMREVTIAIENTQFPAITNIVQSAFETAENKLTNWSQGEITEEAGE